MYVTASKSKYAMQNERRRCAKTCFLYGEWEWFARNNAESVKVCVRSCQVWWWRRWWWGSRGTYRRRCQQSWPVEERLESSGSLQMPRSVHVQGVFRSDDNRRAPEEDTLRGTLEPTLLGTARGWLNVYLTSVVSAVDIFHESGGYWVVGIWYSWWWSGEPLRSSWHECESFVLCQCHVDELLYFSGGIQPGPKYRNTFQM